MKTKLLCFFSLLLLLVSESLSAQNVTLYSQFGGRYDFTFVGNTMNTGENNPSPTYVTNTSSTANLNLAPGNTVLKAYLYWAGSGDGDFEVDLNGIPTTPDRTFSYSREFPPNTFTYFSAFKDITTYVQTTGNGDYTLSNLDISAFEALHFSRKTNFAGWAILIIYENSSLPLNQINVYDGLQGVPEELEINLTNLYVLDNQDARAGFIAWEGDVGLPTETFSVNGQILSNALNPADNVFNGTNSVTNSSTLYNMDLDIYAIDDYIDVGNTNATITLSSWQDFIMINTVVTKLNSQLPDATVSIDNYQLECNSRQIPLNYTVYNVNSTDPLPAGTQIAIYADGELIAENLTPAILQIGESVALSQIITIPSHIPIDFTLTIVVDPNGLITELVETNNRDTENISLHISPAFNQPANLTMCNLGLTAAYFDFSAYEQSIKVNPADVVTFHESLEDAQLDQNAIISIFNYYATTTPHEIFVRIENEFCYATTSFLLLTENCPPTVYNAVSVNGDGLNDTFFIAGLRDIFVNFELLIYNRWGRHIWTGNNNIPDWDGYVKNGVGDNQAPDGTYFYVLKLNDPNYPDAMTGYLYLNH
ncbi:T9SS type B sorting domain-containing protein [Flavobacterium pedocola]